MEKKARGRPRKSAAEVMPATSMRLPQNTLSTLRLISTISGKSQGEVVTDCIAYAVSNGYLKGVQDKFSEQISAALALAAPPQTPSP